MSKLFHVTLTQGRADTLTLEADTKSDVISFLTAITTATISNIKEIVYSKEHNINYVPQAVEQTSCYRCVTVFATSENYAEVFYLYNVKHTVTKEKIIEQIQHLNILDEQINDVVSVTFYDQI
jgi:hypothetical protein